MPHGVTRLDRNPGCRFHRPTAKCVAIVTKQTVNIGHLLRHVIMQLGLAARVMLTVQVFEPFPGYVRVDLCRGKVAVP